MSARNAWLATSAYLKKRPFRASLLAIALALALVWALTADRGWTWLSDTHKLPAMQLSVRRGELFARVWVDRPLQAVRDDSWFVGFRALDLGFWYAGTYQPHGTLMLHGVHYDLYIPLWMPITFLVFPTALLARHGWRTSARIPCASCGYDLQGNESGVCPECGTHVMKL